MTQGERTQGTTGEGAWAPAAGEGAEDAPGLTRRRALSSAAAAGAAVAIADGGPLLNHAALARERRRPIARDGDFKWGVSAGFPLPFGVVLWTRVGGLDRTSKVTLEVAKDRGFRKVVHRSKQLAQKNRDYTVHARVRGLRPHRQYYYRFLTRNSRSRIGTFRTAPPRSSDTPIRIGFFSCQNWQAGFYNAHAGLADEDLDLVVCLGDYIYENGTYEGPRTDGTGANGDGDCQTFPEYRQKYRLYQSDPDLQRMHASHAFVSIWDDHEVEDNYAGELASPAAADGETNAGEPRRVTIADRRRNGYRAFFEAMPRIQRKGDPTRIYGRAQFGRMAELYLLDQRQYRDRQPCDDAFASVCPAAGAAGRDYLGRPQMGWLKRKLGSSQRRWKILGNQLMLMAFDIAPGVAITQDSWEGYQAERTELTSHIVDAGVDNVVAITGDIHTFFSGTVTTTGRVGGTPAAAEFVGGSVTSLGVKETLGGAPIEELEAAIRAADPHISYADFDNRGYGVLSLFNDRAVCEFKAANALKKGAEVNRLAAFELAPGSHEPQRIG